MTGPWKSGHNWILTESWSPENFSQAPEIKPKEATLHGKIVMLTFFI